MRYFRQPDLPFNSGNKAVIIKEPLPLAEVTGTSNVVKVNGDTFLDEVASRAGVYGDHMEPEAYRIFDENIAELFEARFDLSKLDVLRVP